MNTIWLHRIGVGFAVLAMMVLGSADLALFTEVHGGVALVLSAARSVPILLYRRRPYLAWWLAYGTSVATTVTALFLGFPHPDTWPWAYSSMALLAATTGILAAQGVRRRTVVAVALVAVPSLALGLGFSGWLVQNVLICTALVGAAALIGDLVHSRRRVAGDLAEEKQVSAAERTRRSLVEERTRIARELHDVVAHHMSMITVQAETARYRLEGLPEPAVDELTGIASRARGSLTELRGLLSALRDDQDAPALAPQPTLADLDELVDRINAAGTPVRLSVTGDSTGLPDVLHLTAYRIVQEALSNVVRHAAGAPTTVDISVGGELTVEVVNARPAHPTTRDGEGHGLVGLRERATLLGGTFEVDQPDGGWRVRATLPVPGAGR
ncbi:MAG: sensor histidine kinase [Actinophytocola sp.]|uniref:sensor histidine kinase n=1 Tax=Actinophytocola sp. TaxID=1872138 RepID=UPI003D6B8969